MNTRTNGPWTFAKPYSLTGATSIDAADNLPVAWVCGEEVGRDKSQGSINAAFIVEACNAHDALTAENARLREALSECVTDTFSACFVHDDKDLMRRRICATTEIAASALAAGGAE